MRLTTFQTGDDPTRRAGEVRGDEVVAFTEGTILDRLASGDRTPADGDTFALADVTLLAPCPAPVFFGIGLNYAAHAAETGMDQPEKPIVFTMAPTSGADPFAPVKKPDVVTKLDYEGELALVIGQDGEIAGYAVSDDVSARELQKSEPQWTRAKGSDGFCPWGPWITTADEVPDAENLQLRTWVNGDLRQDTSTSDLIFGPKALVDFMHETMTLLPGSVILTGTPSGVGFAMDPRQFLTSGDVVRIEIEMLGAIEHVIA